MITTNINTTPPNYEEQINGFYLTQLDRTYDEGVVLTKSSSIGCRPLAFAIKAGTKILINGISLEVYSDAAQSAVEFFITATTLTESINKGSKITIDKENLFLQYQRKTEGQVAGFDIDADGISKGGVEITGWLNSDTLEGATINNLPTALSVKNYVDNSHPAEDQTLQEVTDRGNTTTNSITTAGATLTAGLTGTTGTFGGNIVVANDQTFKTYIESANIYGNNHLILRSVLSYLRLVSPNNYIFYRAADGHLFQNENGTNEWMRITSDGNVGIGTTSPSKKLSIVGNDGTGIIQHLEGSTSAGATIRFSRGGSYTWQTGVGGSATGNDIPFSNFGIVEGSTSRLVIAVGGNVGIGTTAPESMLHLDGSNAIIRTQPTSDGNLIGLVMENSAGNDAGAILTNSYSGEVKIGGIRTNYFTTFYANNSEKMRITSSGNVGIGTTSPSYKLHIVGETLSEDGFRIKISDDTFQRVLSPTGTKSVQFGDAAIDDLKFKNANGNSLVIKSTGNVGIGTTSPSKRLDIRTNGVGDGIKLTTSTPKTFAQIINGNSETFPYGKITMNYGDTTPLQIVALSNEMQLSGGYNTSGKIVFRSGTSEKMRLTNTGLGIGTTSPEEKLHVVGDTFIDGGLKVNAANIDFTGLGTSDPAVTGRLWSDRGVLKISAG